VKRDVVMSRAEGEEGKGEYGGYEYKGKARIGLGKRKERG